MSTDPTDDLARAVREYVSRYFPGRIARQVRIDLDGDGRVVLPVPILAPAPPPRRSFIPTQLQVAILEALDGKALRTDALARACEVERRRLFKPGGLKELQELDPPKVNHHERLGFYRPDAPPPQLEGEEDGGADA